jgi:hypothetical protein
MLAWIERNDSSRNAPNHACGLFDFAQHAAGPAPYPRGIERCAHEEMTMRVRTPVMVMVAGCATVALLAVSALLAQTPSARQHAAKPTVAMEARCQAMMAEHVKTMAETKAADQRLEVLVGAMNAASGQTKADATAAVVNELVTQRRTMRDGMMKMQQDAMSHMMGHMQAGKGSMDMCPMMKQMDDMKH